MRRKILVLCTCLTLPVVANADVLGGVRFSGSTEIDGDGLSSSLGASPYINYLYSNTRVDFSSTASANLSTAEGFTLSPLNWLAKTNGTFKLPLPSLSAFGSASHNVSDTLFEDTKRITDSYSVGLQSNFNTGRSLSHNITTSYGATRATVENGSSRKASTTDVGTASYTATLQQATGYSVAVTVSGQDYFNDTTSFSASATYIRPRPKGTLTLSLGATNSIQGEESSLALNGLASYSTTLLGDLSTKISISKRRTDTNSLTLLEDIQIETPSQNVVDVTTGSISLSAPALNGRMTNSLSYSLNYIESVFILEEALLFGGDKYYSDFGSAKTSYALNQYSSISLSSQFSVLQGTAIALGNIEYQRELAPKLRFKTGLSSGDFSKGISRWYASLSYDLGLIQSNE